MNTIHTEQQFKDACDKIAVIDLKIQELETARDLQLQTTRDSFAVLLEPLQRERKAFASESGKYAKKYRKALLGSQKSGESPKAFYGFRMSTPRLSTLVRVSWDKVVANAKKAGLLQFIRTVEEVDKDRVKAEATPQQLEALGCKVTQRESFYVKPKDPGAAAAKKETAA